MQMKTEEKGLPSLVVSPEEANVYSLLGRGEARLLLTGENTNQGMWLGYFKEDPGFMTQLHYHPHTDELVYVLDGVLSVYSESKWSELGPGAVGVLPKGKPHAQGNRGDKPVHMIGSGSPAGFDRFFPQVNELVKRMKPGTPEFMQEVKRISAECDSIILGPAPL